MFGFKVLYQSTKSKSRRGRITTPHGIIETPAFVTVGTKATVKSLTPDDLELTKSQFVFSNTYHLVLSPTLEVLEKAGGVHEFSKINKPIITDSGGFQIFSLARENNKTNRQDESPILVKINDDGVTFRSHTDGATYVFTPEFSISAQKIIGADCIVAFDECVYHGASEKYTKRSMERTHDWARRSINEFAKKNRHDQRMYGVIQGGMYQSLRQQSAEYIASLPFWGLAVGGISVGETKTEMRQQLGWVMDVIHTDPRPIHALGIGHIDDIIDMVKMGVDTFDCVTPTRDARVGKLYKSLHDTHTALHETETIDIVKTQYKSDMLSIDEKCQCYTCQNFSRAYLHHLFKQRELLAYRLATIHNLYFMEDFFKEIRKKIEEGGF